MKSVVGERCNGDACGFVLVLCMFLVGVDVALS